MTYSLTVAWAVVIVTTHVPCPLTALQNHLREVSGQRPLSDSFINLYVQGVLYPHHYELAAQGTVAAVVIVSLSLFWRHRPRTDRSSSPGATGAAVGPTTHLS